MRATVLYGPRDVRFEDVQDPTILQPTDAIIRNSATCICGSDLWPYRGLQPVSQPTPFGHEYCGIVEEVGREVRSIKRGHRRFCGRSEATDMEWNKDITAWRRTRDDR